MPIYVRENGESDWAPVAMILTALVVVMVIGYFVWYAPAHSVAVSRGRTVIVNTPAAVAPPSTTTVVMPGSTGAAGPAGANGADGADGAPGSSGRHHRDRDDSADSTDNSAGSSNTGSGSSSNNSTDGGSSTGDK